MERLRGLHKGKQGAENEIIRSFAMQIDSLQQQQWSTHQTEQNNEKRKYRMKRIEMKITLQCILA